ncbi:aminotransferase class V-fold PLP-dependent enzyme [Paenibacillus hodogayensis]|uniref:Aminotransferase class V-fold PLP-dependent enzyme n=1 Tax=Paenibacillus hodogayensis TaxID=279208 RepID=A0ABV5VUA5_9BACL
MEALIERSAFIGLEQATWFFGGAESPPLAGMRDAVLAYVANRSKGPVGRKLNSEVEQACRDNLAVMLQGSQEQIALLSNASEAISAIASSIGLKPGDNVVIHDLEFPSGVLPWLALKSAGVEVRVVASRAWRVSAEELLAMVDGNTRMVVTSHVSYLSGARIDCAKLYRELKQTNALLLLDATQSLGVVPVRINDADFIVASSYKWLMAGHGGGVLAINPERASQLMPRSAGWRSVEDMFSDTRFEHFRFLPDARRFEGGYPAYPMLYAMKASTDLLLSVGIERIERHVLELGAELIEGMKRIGYKPMTPERPEERAGNISFVCEDGERYADELLKRGTYVWGGDGRLRASIHLYNNSDDVARLVGQLEVIAREQAS